MNHDRLKVKLLETINNKRQEMIETANREGYTSETVVKCSQDLDMLLNNYQQILLEEKERTTGSFHEFIKTMKLSSLKERYSLQLIEK